MISDGNLEQVSPSFKPPSEEPVEVNKAFVLDQDSDPEKEGGTDGNISEEKIVIQDQDEDEYSMDEEFE